MKKKKLLEDKTTECTEIENSNNNLKQEKIQLDDSIRKLNINKENLKKNINENRINELKNKNEELKSKIKTLNEKKREFKREIEKYRIEENQIINLTNNLNLVK